VHDDVTVPPIVIMMQAGIEIIPIKDERVDLQAEQPEGSAV
jgi:hypothetical protein